MDVKEIPLLVFEEMSKEFGQGDESVIHYLSRDYRVRELRDGGFIAYAEKPNIELKSKLAHFEIWSHLPSEYRSDIMPVSEIIAGPFFTGSWAYDSRRSMREDVVACFPRYPICLKNPLVTVISSALFFAQTIALSSDCRRDEYWEKDRCPEGIYTHSTL